MTRRQARRLGATDGAEDVEIFAREQGEQALLDASVSGWDEGAINAGVADLQRVPRHLQDAYYVAYERAAQRAARRLRHEIRAKVQRGEPLDAGIYGDPMIQEAA